MFETAILGLFAVALVEFGLAVVVWAQSSRQPVNRWFAAFVTTLAVWGTLVGLRRSLADPSAILLVVRVLYATVALIPVTFSQFASLFPRSAASSPGRLPILTPIGLFMSGLALSPWVVEEVRPQQPDYFQPLYGPLFPMFALYFVISAAWALTHLAGKLRYATGFARAQLHYVFAGAALTAIGGVTLGLLMPLLAGTSRYGMYGPYFTLIWVAFIAHSIVRHRLMDIRVVISRSAAYAVGWAVTSGTLVAGTIVLSEVYLGYNTPPAADVLLGSVGSICFIMVAPWMRRIADRYLFRPAYDEAQLVRDGSRAMATFGDPERVTGAMAELIGGALQPESLAIVVRDGERGSFLPTYTRHIDPASPWPEQALADASPLTLALGRHPDALSVEDLARRTPSLEVAVLADELRAWHAELAVPVQSEGELIGIILIGSKRSGDPFFGDDFDLLDTLASQLAIGLKNAQLYQEIVSIKEYNERILARMDSGVVAVRDDGVLTTFNPAAERITGLAATAVLGRSLDSLNPALREILEGSLVGRPDAEAEITVRHVDGRTLPLVTHTSALHDRAGNVRGAVAVFNDHSRLKALEEDKRRADRLAAIGALATGIAHEIRNPLVAIKTFAELLPERADDQEFRSTFAKVASKEVHRIEELVGRLRALAVPAMARLHPLDLQRPVVETLDLIRGEADRRSVRVVSEMEPDLPAVLGEPDQLKQLFLNLCLNGLEAMGTGGTLSVTVRADRQRPARERAARSRNGAGLVTVRVTDTGPGVPREDLARIFEPFFTTKAHGTGLGLAISRGIADAHRAALWAEAGPAGVGTAFVVQFSAVVAAPVEALR